MRKAIAIDFDGVLFSDAYPEIGIPNFVAIARAKQEKRRGAGLILWTCREGDLLQAAIDACQEYGLTFDAINESLPDWLEAFGNRPRKVGASEYWDDKAVRIVADEEELIREYGTFGTMTVREDGKIDLRAGVHATPNPAWAALMEKRFNEVK